MMRRTLRVGVNAHVERALWCVPLLWRRYARRRPRRQTAQDRRYGQADFLRVYADLEAYARAADRLGYTSLWLAEHHFQHEGYEVVPNAILMAAFLAERTRLLRFGAMFNVLPQWHPLRFAEDFALADVMTGGRMICGIGRGTVPREAEPLGTRVGWNSD